MKVIQGVKWITKGMALVALMSTASTASGTTRFYVECYTSGSAQADMSKEYAYRLKAQGVPEFVENGININLDEDKIISGGDNRLKRLVDIAFHPLESSKNHRLLTGLLRMNWGTSLFSIMIIIREGEGGRGVPRPPS
ncbi:MAG TPA: hypothetical protein V6C90_24460 [Coleofasciculaceae cyanobacterium]